jgi:hypothetical protein
MPLGYRVYEEAHFESVEEFASIVDGMVDRHMTDTLNDKDVLSFRPDLSVSKTELGFIAETALLRRTYENPKFGQHLGQLILTGNHTCEDIVRDLASAGENLLDIHCDLQTLFDAGLLNDDPIHGGIGRHAAAH